MKQRGQILIYAIVALGIIGSLGLIGRKIYTAGEDSVRLEWQQANQKQRDAEAKKGNQAAEKKEKGDAKAKIVYRTITQKVDRYIDRPVYRNICLDDDGLRDANAALVGALTPAAKPDKPMPKPGATE